MNLLHLDRQAGLFCKLDCLLLLEGHLYFVSSATVAFHIPIMTAGFVLSAFVNLLFCITFLRAAKSEERASSIEFINRLGTFPEKLMLIGGVMERDWLVNLVVGMTILVNLLVVFLLV